MSVRALALTALALSLASAVPGALHAQDDTVRAARAVDGMLAFDADATVGDFSGTTREVRGEVRPAPAPATATGWVSFPVASLRTGIGQRDRHMRASLDAERHPEIRLDVTRLERMGRTGDTIAVRLEGTLTVKGIARPVEVPATVIADAQGYHLRSTFPIDVRDWEVGGLRRFLGTVRVDPTMTVRAELTFQFLE